MEEVKKSIWHKASEKPEREEDIVAVLQIRILDNEDKVVLKCIVVPSGDFYACGVRWDDFVSNHSIKRWCYYSDFLNAL